MLDVSTETIINRPIEVVSAFAADPGNAPRWYVNIDSVQWLTPAPLAIGSKLTFTARFLGRLLVYTYEIVELVPGQRLVMRTAQGPFPMETTYMWEAVSPSATRMVLRNRGRPAGFGKLLVPFMSFAVRSANRKDLARLKQLLESRIA